MANSVIPDEGRLIVSAAQGEARVKAVSPPPMIKPPSSTKAESSTRTGQELREVFLNASWPSILVPFGLLVLILLAIVGIALLRN